MLFNNFNMLNKNKYATFFYDKKWIDTKSHYSIFLLLEFNNILFINLIIEKEKKKDFY